MLSRPERSESQPRTKNGQPHHSTAGMAISNCSHCWALRRQEGQEIDAEDMVPHVEGEQREREAARRL